MKLFLIGLLFTISLSSMAETSEVFKATGFGLSFDIGYDGCPDAKQFAMESAMSNCKAAGFKNCTIIEFKKIASKPARYSSEICDHLGCHAGIENGFCEYEVSVKNL